MQEILSYLRDLPLPTGSDHRTAGHAGRPGGVGNVTRGEGIRRGVGYALGMKAIGFSGGKDDTCTARVTVWIRDGEPVAEVYCAGPEIGQGIVTLEAQIARTELGGANRGAARQGHQHRRGGLVVRRPVRAG